MRLEEVFPILLDDNGNRNDWTLETNVLNESVDFGRERMLSENLEIPSGHEEFFFLFSRVQDLTCYGERQQGQVGTESELR